MGDKDVRAWRGSFDDVVNDLGREGAGASDRGLVSVGISSLPAALQNEWAPPRSGLMVDFFAEAEKVCPVRSPAAATTAAAASRDLDVPDLNLCTSDLAIDLFSLSNEVNQRKVKDQGLADREGEIAIKKEKEAAQAELARSYDENLKLKNIINKLTVEYGALHARYMNLLREQTMRNQEISSTEVERTKFIKQYDGAIKVPRQYAAVLSSSRVPMEEEVTQNNNSSDADHKQAGGGSKRSRPTSLQQGTHSILLQPPLRNSSDQNLEESLRKKARVLIRTRVEAPKIEDGGRWKKYGQKTAKGNNNPRAYFRCNVSKGCPVLKRVQRCAEDSSVLITIYEGGAHNHPLDPAAMVVASATSTAVEMILSGSMAPSKGLRMNPNSIFANAIILESSPFPSVIVDLTGAPHPALPQQQRPTTTAAAAAVFQVPLAGGGCGGGDGSSLPHVFGQQLQLLADQAASSAPLSSELVSATTAAIIKDPSLAAAFFAQINSVVHRQGVAGSQESSDGY